MFMLRSMQDLENYSIGATDGPIGHVRDFFFDDHLWVVRYLVVATGSWLASRKVLISPISIGRPDRAQKSLPVALTREQVKHSPDIDTERPVSRQHEMHYLEYFDYPYYWEGAGMWGAGAYPNMMMPGNAGFVAIPRALAAGGASLVAEAEAAQREDDDPHLRSCKAVSGYEIHAIDGDIGHVRGFLFDEESWAIRYLVVDTSDWWTGHQVLLPPQWITDVSWAKSRVAVQLSRAAVKDAPPYDDEVPLDRAREIAIYRHYGRPVYWDAPTPAEQAA
jgi:hypothetical protein